MFQPAFSMDMNREVRIGAVPQEQFIRRSQRMNMSGSDENVLVRHLAPRNFLSFGPDHDGIDLKALNCFIGPNGSGKSNLIEAVGLMRSAPKELRDVTRKGGGVAEWIWKGASKEVATVEWVINKDAESTPLRHVISFRSSENQSFRLLIERVEDAAVDRPESELPATTYYSNRYGRAVIRSPHLGPRVLEGNEVEPDRSILAQRRDPDTYPELSSLARSYEKIRIYRECNFGRNAVFREPQKADMRNDFLEEDFSNLGLFLNRLKSHFPAAQKAILKGLKSLYDGIDDFNVSIEGGTVQVFFTEGEFVIPATRLSDGTLRYLCLLAILCDPKPPMLVCIEEPELGLHPDILPTVADLLKSASERTQLIVTTHSDILVDAMTDCPEAVVVCEKHEGKTQMKRLSPPDLAVWLDKYRLGQLWIDGQLGGKRW